MTTPLVVDTKIICIEDEMENEFPILFEHLYSVEQYPWCHFVPFWWSWVDLNHRPMPYQDSAATAELHDHILENREGIAPSYPGLQPGTFLLCQRSLLSYVYVVGIRFGLCVTCSTIKPMVTEAYYIIRFTCYFIISLENVCHGCFSTRTKSPCWFNIYNITYFHQITYSFGIDFSRLRL